MRWCQCVHVCVRWCPRIHVNVALCQRIHVDVTLCQRTRLHDLAFMHAPARSCVHARAGTMHDAATSRNPAHETCTSLHTHDPATLRHRETTIHTTCTILQMQGAAEARSPKRTNTGPTSCLRRHLRPPRNDDPHDLHDPADARRSFSKPAEAHHHALDLMPSIRHLDAHPVPSTGHIETPRFMRHAPLHVLEHVLADAHVIAVN